MARTGWRAGKVGRRRGATVTPPGRSSRQVAARVLKSPHTSHGVPSPPSWPDSRRSATARSSARGGGGGCAPPPPRRPPRVDRGQPPRPRLGRLVVGDPVRRVHPPLLHP